MRPRSVNNNTKASKSKALPLKARKQDIAVKKGRVKYVNYIIT